MNNIFTYGSLMFEPVWSKVVTRTYESMPGIVYGVRRKRVVGETYPCMIWTGQDEHVNGIVYLNVSHEDCQRLDQFEGEYYCRSLMDCLLPDKNVVDAYAYILRKEFFNVVDENDWDVHSV